MPHLKIKIISSFTHIHAVPNVYDFFFVPVQSSIYIKQMHI